LNNKEKKRRQKTDKASLLRNRAEEKAKTMGSPSIPTQSPEEIEHMIHELQVHQIELEMQNEQLRHAQKQIEIDRLRYFDLYDLAPVGYCTINQKGMILESNLTLANMLDLDRIMMIKQPFSSFILNEDEDIYYLFLKRLLEKSTPQTCELRIVKSDKISFWVSLHATVNQDEEGTKCFWVTISDINQQKELEEILEHNRNLLHSIISALPGLLLVVDQHHNILLTNENKIRSGKVTYDSIDDVLGKKCYQMFMKRQAPCPWCNLEKVIDTGQSYSKTTTPKDLREEDFGKTLRILTVPVKDKEEHVIGAVEYGIDVSELKNAELKAEQANQAKSLFLANMSHELRTPLNGIIGFTDILRTTPLKEDQQGFADIVYSSAKHLTEIIADILDFSKIEAGKLELSPEKTNLRKLIDDTCAITWFKAEEKGLFLTHSVENNVPENVTVDGPKLRQILVNLLTNAVKFSDEGTVVLTVSLLERQGDKARLLFKVIDTGMGIKEKDRARIFDPFHQANMSTSKKAQGAGLGLSIVTNLLEKMGSVLEFKSTFGEGSTFYFELLTPVERQQPKELNRTNTERKVEVKSFKGKKILIAEDNPVNMRYAQTALSMFSKDIQIITAENGKEAYKQYLEHTPNLILMDIIMPSVDGYQATKMIRQCDTQIPIIAMTAKALSEDKEDCLAAGMSDYIAKPVTLDELKEVLKKHL